MSKPLYTWRESAEMTSPLNFLAISTASPLLPEAVGPTIAKIFGKLIVFMNMPFYTMEIKMKELTK
jgi:hypothetical protein